MDVVVERCAGLDVHRDNVVATVRVPGSGRRRWRAADADVQGDTRGARRSSAEWLAGFGVTLVGMEATGVYWKTVFYALEHRFECWFVERAAFAQRGVGLALRLLSDLGVEQSSLVGFDLDS